MAPVRIAFDPALPVLAAATLQCGAQTFKPDEPFPWRELGLSEFELRAFWLSGLVRFVPVGELAKVETPKPRRKRPQPQPTE